MRIDFCVFSIIKDFDKKNIACWKFNLVGSSFELGGK